MEFPDKVVNFRSETRLDFNFNLCGIEFTLRWLPTKVKQNKPLPTVQETPTTMKAKRKTFSKKQTKVVCESSWKVLGRVCLSRSLRFSNQWCSACALLTRRIMNVRLKALRHRSRFCCCFQAKLFAALARVLNLCSCCFRTAVAYVTNGRFRLLFLSSRCPFETVCDDKLLIETFDKQSFVGHDYRRQLKASTWTLIEASRCLTCASLSCLMKSSSS